MIPEYPRQFSYKCVNFVHYTGQKVAFFCLSEVFCDQNMLKYVSGRPEPRRGDHNVPQSAGEGIPLYRPHPLSAFGASILVPPTQAWCPPLRPRVAIVERTARSRPQLRVACDRIFISNQIKSNLFAINEVHNHGRSQ